MLTIKMFSNTVKATPIMNNNGSVVLYQTVNRMPASVDGRGRMTHIIPAFERVGGTDVVIAMPLLSFEGDIDIASDLEIHYNKDLTYSEVLYRGSVCGMILYAESADDPICMRFSMSLDMEKGHLHYRSKDQTSTKIDTKLVEAVSLHTTIIQVSRRYNDGRGWQTRKYPVYNGVKEFHDVITDDEAKESLREKYGVYF